MHRSRHRAELACTGPRQSDNSAGGGRKLGIELACTGVAHVSLSRGLPRWAWQKGCRHSQSWGGGRICRRTSLTAHPILKERKKTHLISILRLGPMTPCFLVLSLFILPCCCAAVSRPVKVAKGGVVCSAFGRQPTNRARQLRRLLTCARCTIHNGGLKACPSFKPGFSLDISACPFLGYV